MNAFLLEVTQQSDPFDASRELTLSEALDAPQITGSAGLSPQAGG